MTLLQAFRECAPLIGDPLMDATRSSAWGLLYEELHALARRVEGRREDVEDAIGIVAIRLQQAGPRYASAGAPDTDSRVRGYLVNAVKNAVKDLRAARGHLAPAEPADIPDVHAEDPEQTAARHAREAEEGEARAQLFQELVPAVAAQLRADARDEFVRYVEFARLLSEGAAARQDLVRNEFGGLDARSRDAFDQRLGRTRRRLFKGLEGLLSTGPYSSERSVALRAAASRLRTA